MTAPAAGQAERIPFTFDKVLYLDEGNRIYALWTSDPELWAAGARAIFDALLRFDVETELIADGYKHRKRDGSTFSGWVVTYGIHSSDAMPRKADAWQELKSFTAERFVRRRAAR